MTTKDKALNPLTMTDQELIEHASKQVQALRMALDMIECEKYERRHVRWAIIDALKDAALAQPEQETEEQRLLRRKWFGHRDTEHLSFAEAVDATMEKLYSQPEPFGYFQYDIRLDAWVQNRVNNKGVAFYI